MKFKETFGSQLVAGLILPLLVLVVLPLWVLFLLFKVLTTPWEYLRYKRSRYQRDFPHTYTWLRQPHVDNEAYTVIKEDQLPVAYVKGQGDYDQSGYFLYGDHLLIFREPLSFDAEKGLWLFDPYEDVWDATRSESEYEEENEDVREEEIADDRLTVDATREYLARELSMNVSGRECRRVVFFYQRGRALRRAKKAGLAALRQLDDVVIYEKGELAEAIRQWIVSNR